MLLDKIEKANDIKKIDKSDYGELAEEIRQFLIEKISVTGGHLGSNLGAVELTMGTSSCSESPGGQDHLGCRSSVLYPQNINGPQGRFRCLTPVPWHEWVPQEKRK